MGKNNTSLAQTTGAVICHVPEKKLSHAVRSGDLGSQGQDVGRIVLTDSV